MICKLYEKTLIQTMLNAGNFLSKTRPNKIETKSDGTLVTDVDPKLEELIIRHLRKLPLNFRGEELGFVDYGFRDTAIIDPVDGTKEFVNGGKKYAISIGIERKIILNGEEKSDIIEGYIYDIGSGLLYANDKILDINGNPVRSKIEPTGKIALRKEFEHSDLYKRFRNKNEYEFINGSVAINMIETAYGKYDRYIYQNPKCGPWDTAGALGIINHLDNVEITGIKDDFDYKNPQQTGFVVVYTPPIERKPKIAKEKELEFA